jgi:PhnB protein
VKRAFGAEEIARIPNPNGAGIGHAEFRIGDAVVMAFDAWPGWPETRSYLRLFVDDGDAVYKRALHAGATPVTRVTHLLFGDRVGRVCDPLGTSGWLQAHVEEVSPTEMQRRMTDKSYTDAMAYVQTSLDSAMKGSRPRSA